MDIKTYSLGKKGEYDGGDVVSYLLGKNSGGGGGGDTPETLLLLHFNNDYTDYSEYHRVPTTVRQNVTYASGKFDLSLDLSVSGKALLVYDTLYDLVENDFTIDFWIYPKNFQSSNAGVGRPILGNYVSNKWYVVWNLFVSEYQGNIKKWGFRYDQFDQNFKIVSSTELKQNEWQHLAVTYKKSTKNIVLYVNGIKDAEITIDFDMVAPVEPAYLNFSVGSWFNYSYEPLSYIDELRISKGVRYNGNFTPPTEPYE